MPVIVYYNLHMYVQLYAYAVTAFSFSVAVHYKVSYLNDVRSKMHVHLYACTCTHISRVHQRKIPEQNNGGGGGGNFSLVGKLKIIMLIEY